MLFYHVIDEIPKCFIMCFFLPVHEEEAESLRMKLLEQRNEEESKSEKIVADVIALLESSEQDSSKDAVSTPDVALSKFRSLH